MGNACCYSRFISKKLKVNTYKTIMIIVLIILLPVNGMIQYTIDQ